MDWFIKRITNPFFTTVSLQKNCTCQKTVNIQRLDFMLQGKLTPLDKSSDTHRWRRTQRAPQKTKSEKATVVHGDIFNRHVSPIAVFSSTWKV